MLVAMELGHTSPAFRSVIGTNVGIGSQGVVMFGSDAQKREWLPKLASGEVVSSFCLTEPDAGSDARRSRPLRYATASTTSSTAPSASSPTPTAPACSR